MLLTTGKLNAIETWISKALIDSYITHDVPVNNVLREYDDMKEAIKNPKTFNSVHKYIWYNKKISISEGKFTYTNYERLKKHWVI